MYYYVILIINLELVRILHPIVSMRKHLNMFLNVNQAIFYLNKGEEIKNKEEEKFSY